MGLRIPLVLLLVAAAIVYMGSAVFNEKSMRQFYGTHQLPGGIDFDAPEQLHKHTLKTNKHPSNENVEVGKPKKENGKEVPLLPKRYESSKIGSIRHSNHQKAQIWKRLNATSGRIKAVDLVASKLSSIANQMNHQLLANGNNVSSARMSTKKASNVSIPKIPTSNLHFNPASKSNNSTTSTTVKSIEKEQIEDQTSTGQVNDEGETDDVNQDEVGEEGEEGIDDSGEVVEGDEDSTGEGGDEEVEEVTRDGGDEDVAGASMSANELPVVSRPWLRLNRTTAFTGNRTMVPFEKQEGVVIATKIHGPHQLFLLKQSLCLLHFAYNRRPLYDIIVFTTLPVPDEDIASVRALVYPARLTVVVDNRGLQEEIAALSKPRYDAFLKACGVESPVNLTWWSNCPGRIAYNWQAEFRAWHVWRHPSLANYSYMMWLDSDAFCTEEWTVDPIQAVVENNLVILFDNWPKGAHRGRDVEKRIYKAFGQYLCKTTLVRGHLKTKLSNTTCKNSPRLGDIHGFFHITNLDFYRSHPVQKWAETWIGNGFLQRRYDDQAGVTIPAAILAPDRAWDMRHNKIRLNVYHNFDLDGKKSSGNRVGGFIKYWKATVKNQLPDAVGICPIKATN